MAKAKVDLIGKLVEELQTFKKFKDNSSEIIDLLVYNDLESLGGDTVKIGDKTVRTLKENIKDYIEEPLNINIDAEHKLDIVQNSMGDIIGFRSSYFDNLAGQTTHTIKATNSSFSDTYRRLGGLRDIRSSEGINGYNLTKFDKTGAKAISL